MRLHFRCLNCDHKIGMFLFYSQTRKGQAPGVKVECPACGTVLHAGKCVFFALILVYAVFLIVFILLLFIFRRCSWHPRVSLMLFATMILGVASFWLSLINCCRFEIVEKMNLKMESQVRNAGGNIAQPIPILTEKWITMISILFVVVGGMELMTILMPTHITCSILKRVNAPPVFFWFLRSWADLRPPMLLHVSYTFASAAGLFFRRSWSRRLFMGLLIIDATFFLGICIVIAVDSRLSHSCRAIAFSIFILTVVFNRWLLRQFEIDEIRQLFVRRPSNA